MAIHIGRREAIAALGSAAVAGPLAARAQQPGTRVRRIAVLLRIAQDDPDAQRDLQSFRKGLWELGWTVGSNILIEYRYASADPAQMQNHAAELVGLPAEVVLASGSFAVAALRRETRTTGGLISYGPNSADLFRRAAAYVDRILKGENPADLSIQRPTTFQLAINLKTAKARCTARAVAT